MSGVDGRRFPSPAATVRSRYLYPSPVLITRIDTVTAVTSAFVTKVRHDPQEGSMVASSSQESARIGANIIPAKIIQAIVAIDPARSTSPGKNRPVDWEPSALGSMEASVNEIEEVLRSGL